MQFNVLKQLLLLFIYNYYFQRYLLISWKQSRLRRSSSTNFRNGFRGGQRGSNTTAFSSTWQIFLRTLVKSKRIGGGRFDAGTNKRLHSSPRTRSRKHTSQWKRNELAASTANGAGFFNFFRMKRFADFRKRRAAMPERQRKRYKNSRKLYFVEVDWDQD